MMLGSNIARATLLGALLGAFWAAGGCSDSGTVYLGGQTEQSCGAICQRKSKAEQELGCMGNPNSLCYEECRVSTRDCSANLLGALANCVSGLDKSAYSCGANGEAVLSASACSTEKSAWSNSCTAGSGGNGSGGSGNPSGGSANPSGGSANPSGGSANPSGGSANPSGGSANPSGGSANPSGGVPGSGGFAGDFGEGGTGDTPATCEGTRTPCAELDFEECEFAPGCFVGEACSGVALDCEELGELECDDQAGCSWDIDYEECVGTAVPCSARANVDLCENHLECIWGEEDTCTGTATPCASLTEEQCFDAPGCNLF